MAHGDLAQTAALLGAGGSVLALVPRGRLFLLTGFALLTAAEASLTVALVPGSDLNRLDSPLRLAAICVAALAVVALGVALARWASFVPLLVLLAAPFRLPVDLGSQHAFLLIPLYGVLAASSVALLVRAARGPVGAIPPLLSVPAAAFIVLDAISLLWARDLQQGSIELAFFIFPFAALVAAVARSPFAAWLPRALAATIVGLGVVFAGIGLWQEWTRTVFFARDLRVANVYTSYFRVTGVFKDPSIYGRHLVLAIAVLLVLLWLGRVGLLLATLLGGIAFAGLYFSYSQSSMAVLFVAALAITLALGDGRSRRIVAVAALAAALAGGALAVTTAHNHSLRKATSGRSRLVAVTATVIRKHPLVGVGVGSQPLASREEAKTRFGASRNASHTTPLTVAAELGALGVVLYLALLAAAARLLFLASRRRRAAGLGFAAVFLVLLLHSVFYSGFFEDPITWGVLAAAAALLAVPLPEGVRDEAPDPRGAAPRRPGLVARRLGRAAPAEEQRA
jgi:putative inorganic carbon (HCO3(-)) transporter